MRTKAIVFAVMLGCGLSAPAVGGPAYDPGRMVGSPSGVAGPAPGELPSREYSVPPADTGDANLPGRLVDGHHDIDNAGECEGLPGTQSTGERGGCLGCVGRTPHHHFVPEFPPGAQCRLDDGTS